MNSFGFLIFLYIWMGHYDNRLYFFLSMLSSKEDNLTYTPKHLPQDIQTSYIKTSFTFISKRHFNQELLQTLRVFNSKHFFSFILNIK